MAKKRKQNYKHIIFDIDGTMLDTATADLLALQQTLLALENRVADLSELEFVLGIPGDVALRRLAVCNLDVAYVMWSDNFKRNFHQVSLFPGVESLIGELKAKGYELGIITSKNKVEYNNDFVPFGLSSYFNTVVCVDDSCRPKPSPDPMLKYIELTGAKADEIVYIGDTMYDMECASGAGVDFGLALWGCKNDNGIEATYRFSAPSDVLTEIGI